MSSVHRFLSLTSAERRRLVRAFFAVAGVRLGLSIVQFPRFQAVHEWVKAAPRAKRGKVPTTGQLAHDVRVVSHYVPRATCLTQALAGQLLLERHGYPTVVHVGVTKEEGKAATFQAHAWLESDGKVVIGETEVPYVPLTTLS